MVSFLNGDYSGNFVDMTLVRGMRMADEDTTKDLLSRLVQRIGQVRQEHEVFRAWCDRADGMYFPEIGKKGADLWAEDESAKVNGRRHVSINSPAAYVDIPASLQAVEPVEDILPTEQSDAGRMAAAAKERVYSAWKREEDFDVKWHKAITVKGLYGRTAARIYWDKDEKRPCFEVIQTPRNLFLGWKTDNFEELEWVAYRMYYDPMSLTEQYGVEVRAARDDSDGSAVPLVFQRDWDSDPARVPAAMLGTRIEVYDYWYREAVWSKGKFIRMKTMNAVIAGNMLIRKPTEYKEYKGRLPYVPLFNTFVPGLPGGRPDLYDIEPLIREKMEMLTAGSQMIANVTRGDSFQLVGPEAPKSVPKGLTPTVGGIVAPGPGNRIEAIQPFVAQFQLEQFLGRIDREKSVVSGLNDLLLGLAPAQVLSSSKAINALIANYESRIAMRRRLLYQWRRKVWELAFDVMREKNMPGTREIEEAGGGFLEITDPSLSPRDDMETAQRAINLLNNKVWSQRTAMNVVGIDDPETEQDLIREERTDATMFPADVQVMAQLLGALQALGLQPNAQTQGMAQQQANNGQADLRNALGAGAQGTDASQYGTQPQVPAIPGAPAEAQPGNASGLPLASPPDNAPVMQGMVQNGTAKGRIMTSQKLGKK